MAVEFTPEQQSAIDSRGGALIVAAAAGSGKTAVLVERVIRRVTDVENPADIDSLLIVTFTNAAAGEMRERVAASLDMDERRVAIAAPPPTGLAGLRSDSDCPLLLPGSCAPEFQPVRGFSQLPSAG